MFNLFKKDISQEALDAYIPEGEAEPAPEEVG